MTDYSDVSWRVGTKLLRELTEAAKAFAKLGDAIQAEP